MFSYKRVCSREIRDHINFFFAASVKADEIFIQRQVCFCVPSEASARRELRGQIDPENAKQNVNGGIVENASFCDLLRADPVSTKQI